MQIRTRLTLQFLAAGSIILIIASIAIYYFSANFRKNEFHNQLKNKALSTGNLIFGDYEVDASRIRKVEKYNPIDLHEEKILVINSKHDTVYSTDKDGVIKMRKDIIKKVEAGYMVMGKQGNYDVIGLLYFTNYDMFIIIAAAIDKEGHLHLEKLLTILIIVCLTGLLLIFIIGWFYSGQAIKPIADIVKKMEKISATKLDLRLNEASSKDEIGRLAKTFNTMLERLEVSFASQKTFIANASHELRTPLTSINGQLEVLLMKDRTAEEYKSETESVLNDIKALIDLSNRLLLMARSSSEVPMKFNTKVRIDEIIWQVKDEIHKANKNYNINIAIDGSLTDFVQMTVIGDAHMLKVAISNIVDNACKYSDDNKVEIKLNHVAQNIELEFKDKGIGISEEGLKKIFEPFYRDDNTASTQGFGIGLPLANQIIKSHNGIIEITSKVNAGTCIVIKLPSVT